MTTRTVFGASGSPLTNDWMSPLRIDAIGRSLKWAIAHRSRSSTVRCVRGRQLPRWRKLSATSENGVRPSRGGA